MKMNFYGLMFVSPALPALLALLALNLPSLAERTCTRLLTYCKFWLRSYYLPVIA